jgi:beta-galactosidase
VWNDFYYGVCYYPEHWNPSRHESDVGRIAAAGFNVVRLGEGAWSYWEPEEGRYQFEMFDRVIDLCRRHGLKVVMGTPTYAGPAWIAHKYPEVLRHDFQRIPMRHGSRRFYNYTSAKYLELSDRICTALAEHYKSEALIIAWQLDNEFNCHMDVSYAPSDTIAFREWLREKYETLEKLNAAWGTAFWSRTYTDWEQIDLPAPTATYHNPTQLLDETRFISDCVVRYARRQAAILRKANPDWLITHNGLFNNVNGPDLVRDLDFFSHDQYPLFYDHWTLFANNLAQARSLAYLDRRHSGATTQGGSFAVLEQQAGPGGQMEYLHRTPRPGEMRLWAWQSILHGAKVLCYFRWRTCPYGQEQHWHGLLDPDDRDNRRLGEASQIAEELKRLPDGFFDTSPDQVVAVMRDFDNEANDRRINTYSKEGHWEGHRWLAEFARQHIPADMVWSQTPQQILSAYKLLVAPHLRIMTPDLAAKLGAYVRSGGTLVLAAQSAIKNPNCHLVEETAPGLFRDLAGVEIEEFTTLSKGESRDAVLPDSSQTISFNTVVERLRPTTAQTLATWQTEDPLLSAAPAITRNAVGQGAAYYFAGYSLAPAIQTLTTWLLPQLNLHSLIQAPPEIELLSKGPYLCLLNHSPQPQSITNIARSGSLLDDRLVESGQLTLPPHGVAILQRRP